MAFLLRNLRQSKFFLFFGILGFLLLLMYFLSPIIIAKVLLIIGLFFLFYYRPEFGVVALIGTLATIFLPLPVYVNPASFPVFKLMSRLTFSLPEIIFLILWAIFIYKIITYKNFLKNIKTPIAFPLIIFIVVIFIGIFNSGLLQGVTYSNIISALREVIYYSIFFPILYLIQKPNQVKFIWYSLLIIALIISLMVIVQTILGPGNNIFPQGIVDPNVLSEGGGTLRVTGVRGLFLIFVLFFPVFGLAISRLKTSWIYLIIFYILTFCLFAILTRTIYYFMPFGLILFLFLIQKFYLRKFLLSFIIIFFLSGMTFLFMKTYYPVETFHFTESFKSRNQELFQTELSEVKNMRTRNFESRDYWRQIQDKIFGGGIGKSYYILSEGIEKISVHNGYLTIIGQIGILGLIVFVWLNIVAIIRCFYISRKIKDDFWRSIAIGLFVSFICFFPMSWVADRFFSYSFTIIFMPLIWGMIELIGKFQKENS